MKFASLFILPLSLTLAAQAPATRTAPTTTAATTTQTLKDTEELRALRDSFDQVLNSVRDSWFGSPYRQINAVDISGSLVLAIKGGAMDAKIEQLTSGVIKSAGVRSGQAFCTLQGTYFANGDHLYKLDGDLGVMRFQREGQNGFWYAKDQNVYTRSIDSAPPNAPVSFMGWFADMISDIKDVYVKGSVFQVSKGRDLTVSGKVANSVVFNAPTGEYDPRKREQAASDTFSFWKKGRMEVAYDAESKLPLRMDYANIAQGIEASMTFTYDGNGRVRQVAIANKSKQWEGPGFVSVTYDGNGMMNTIVGELTGETHKIGFSLATKWQEKKPISSIRGEVPPATATRLGREDMELRLAMMFAANIGDLQRAGFNIMAPRVAPTRK